METAYIGLGGNVGDVVKTMAGALKQFDDNKGISVLAVSNVYRTSPWGVEDQDWFHNACAKLAVSLQPIELLDECLKIEQHYGRERRIRWGPRTLDLDVLLFGSQSIETDRLTVPHPRMTEREFVVLPLADIAPDLRVNGAPIREWMIKLEDTSPERVELPELWWKL